MRANVSLPRRSPEVPCLVSADSTLHVSTLTVQSGPNGARSISRLGLTLVFACSCCLFGVVSRFVWLDGGPDVVDTVVGLCGRGRPRPVISFLACFASFLALHSTLTFLVFLVSLYCIQRFATPAVHEHTHPNHIDRHSPSNEWPILARARSDAPTLPKQNVTTLNTHTHTHTQPGGRGGLRGDTMTRHFARMLV